jgi:hypothetical protein
MTDQRDRDRTTSNPNRPAYDNPVGNKGGLAAGANRGARTRKSKPAARAARPIGHKSDRKLGTKPAPG